MKITGMTTIPNNVTVLIHQYRNGVKNFYIVHPPPFNYRILLILLRSLKANLMRIIEYSVNFYRMACIKVLCKSFPITKFIKMRNKGQTWRGLYGEGASDPYKSHCPVVLPISSKSKYTLLSPYFATTAPALSNIQIQKKKKN